MRNYLLCALCGIFSALNAQTIPEPMSPPRMVNDFAGMFSEHENALLERKLRNYHDTTSTQIYVVTIISFDGYDKAQFAAELGEQWGIGQRGKDNGAVILIKPKSAAQAGEIFIASGYGVEGALPDIILNQIIDQTILPAFRQEQYYQGVDAAIDRMVACLSGEYTAPQSGMGGAAAAVVIILFFAFFFIVLIRAASKGGGSGGGGIPFISGSGGFHGGSSSGSSFGGGGGGRFGGGGAGGRW
jgi:uncharacterized protein